MSSLDRLYRDVENLKQQYKGLAGGPQLALSSIENGSIDSKDADGNLKMTIGEQDDGGNTINVLAGPTPPTPTGFTVDTDYGKFILHWSGDFDGEALAPSDWSRAEVHASQDPFFVPSRATARGSIVSAAGGEVTIGVLKGPWTVKMLAWSQAGKMSAPSAPVDVEVPSYGDIVLEEIDAATTLIKNAGEMLLEGQQTLADKLAGIADLDPEEISEEIARAREDAIAAALAEIEAVSGDLTTKLGLKNETTWSTSNPPTTYSGTDGDTWIKLTSLGSGGREIGRWRWNGSVWVTHPVDGAILSNIDASTINAGFLDVVNRIRAGAILADKLLIGGDRNLIPNGDLSAGSALGWDSAFTYQTSDTPSAHSGAADISGMATSRAWGNGQYPVSPGDVIVLEMWVKADKADSRIYQEVRDQDGAHLATSDFRWAPVEGSGVAQSYYYPVSGYIVPTAWTKLVSRITVRPGVTAIYMGSFYPNHSSGTERTATYSLAGVKLYKPVGGTLITPGGVQTPHLAADVLEVGNLKAGTAALAEAVIKKLFAEVVVAQMVQAEEFIGENAILTGAVTASKITASEELTAKVAEFLTVRAEMIDADVFRNRLFEGVDIIGSRFTVKDDKGDVRTQLSPEGNTFKGEVEADTLVVNGGAELRGTDNTLAQGAKLTIAAGVTDPTAPPTVQPFWDGLALTSTVDEPRGLAGDGSNYWTVRRNNQGLAVLGTSIYARKINPSTGAVSALTVELPGYQSGANNSVYISELLGVTCIGSEMFFLGRYGYRFWVYVTNLSGTYLRRWEYPDPGYSESNPLTYRPGIGNDGTNVVIAQCDDAGPLNIRTYIKTTGALISAAKDTSDNTKSDVTGVYVGTADWGGSTKYAVIAKAKTQALPAFNATTGVYDSSKSFYVADGTNDTGVVWAGGKFRTLDPTGTIHEYADVNTGDASGDWWAVYRWSVDADNDGYNDYTSRISPSVRFTWPRRSKLKFIGAPLPQGVGYITPSVAKKTTQPVRTDFRTPNWSVREGESVAWYNSLPSNWAAGAAPGDTNDFPEAESAVLQAASGTFRLQGDGSGYWGPLKMGRNGIMSGLIVHGYVTITPDAANQSKKVTITLPAGRFTKPPVIWAQCSTSVPERVSVGVLNESITTGSFDLYFTRTNTTTTGVDWYAMDEG
ncbi:hypothetical protein [Brevibacterium sp. H-BE7]|uniref:hypothetical protein n=2 Tax=unclassified Brevibacterium TaxID=2614124 RepID=UPI00254D672E|nr:hypothetical protein [Brevibacterium sp. H-BE7]MDK8434288.1 hypothetical protein [Brevibacterium sp. H-BE7]